MKVTVVILRLLERPGLPDVDDFSWRIQLVFLLQGYATLNTVQFSFF